MSQEQMRAMAVMLLHHHAFMAPPPRAEPLAPPPMLEPPATPAVAPPRAWYARAWEWLRRRYLLLDWEP